MSALFVVLPLALVVSSLAVIAFVWSVRRGDMDDLVTPALRVLDDDDGAPRRDDGHAATSTSKPPGQPAE